MFTNLSMRLGLPLPIPAAGSAMCELENRRRISDNLLELADGEFSQVTRNQTDLLAPIPTCLVFSGDDGMDSRACQA